MLPGKNMFEFVETARSAGLAVENLERHFDVGVDFRRRDQQLMKPIAHPFELRPPIRHR